MKLRNKYYILRHGETIYQTEKKEWIYPKTDSQRVKLTKNGQKQIKRAARKLKEKMINLIFSSDFFRARQTAKIVAAELGIKKIYFNKQLRDINLGVYRGKTKDEFYKDFPQYSKKWFTKSPRGGESRLECQKRMADFLRKIDKKYQGKTILIISHGDPLWLLEGYIKNWSIAKLIKERKDNFIKVGEFREI